MTPPAFRAMALLLAAMPVFAQAPAEATDRAPVQIDMSGTSIIGDQELPNVLYVVPWKDPTPVHATIRIEEQHRNPLPGHLKRDALQRQLRYQTENAGAAGID